MLGKRKRETRIVSRAPKDSRVPQLEQAAGHNAEDIFRRHFEARFTPLPAEAVLTTPAEKEEALDVSDAQSEASAWSGLSASSNQVSMVEIVDHRTTENGNTDGLHRSQQKAFMSSKPPRDASILNETKQAKTPDESDPAEMLNLKRDLDLQRLLKESHLLEKSKASESPGKQRQMALDMRLQALGAKESIFAQQRMPVAHRLGITKKADQKEARRRKDAKENGVILERVTKKSTSKRPRDRGVDVPGVGKFAGGTLKLSRRDVANIQGPPTAARKGKRR